ncbi:hypothetical protein FE782_25245 [Paenibacillus antri]|uniref:Uncharacterized protein n=1 Tax=Paenibacillus antri TaxID=2582848 RepID=A0A5R9GDH2_9BACL|nr:hypothetical protein [Paenibacillus antri]TLS49425.1 hypothetical protein FE782_25245 [Paenibacillus antri]
MVKHKLSLDVREILRQLEFTFEQWEAYESNAMLEERPTIRKTESASAVAVQPLETEEDSGAGNETNGFRPPCDEG